MSTFSLSLSHSGSLPHSSFSSSSSSCCSYAQIEGRVPVLFLFAEFHLKCMRRSPTYWCLLAFLWMLVLYATPSASRMLHGGWPGSTCICPVWLERCGTLSLSLILLSLSLPLTSHSPPLSPSPSPSFSRAFSFSCARAHRGRRRFHRPLPSPAAAPLPRGPAAPPPPPHRLHYTLQRKQAPVRGLGAGPAPSRPRRRHSRSRPAGVAGLPVGLRLPDAAPGVTGLWVDFLASAYILA